MTGYYDQMLAKSAQLPHWLESSPTNILTLTAAWSRSPSPTLSHQKLQFFSDSVCQNALGNEISLGSVDQESYQFSGVCGGTYTFRVISVSSDGFKGTSSCSSPISISISVPNATNLGWTQASPVNATSATASWTKSISSVLSDQKIQFFCDGTCTTPSGALIDLSSPSEQSYVFSALNGTYSYRITSVDTSGNLNTSSCSNAIVIDDLASASLSTFTTIPASIPADGSTTAMITITLLDAQSLPVSGKVVSVSSSRGSIDTVTATSATTDASGVATFTLNSSKIGLPTLSVSVASDSVILTQVGHVTLLAAGAVPQTDYQAWLASSGLAPGSNSLPTSSFKELTQTANSNNGTLYNFGYTTSSGWAGDGSLLTSGALGPNRLVFNGTSNYLDLGSSINSNSSFSFETWARPQSPTTVGSVLLSNINTTNAGFTLSESFSNPGYVSLSINSASYSLQILDDNPLIYWKLDETSGTSVNDYSGNGNGGTFYTSGGSISLNSQALLAGSSASVVFPGNSSSTAYSNTAFTNPSPFTLEAWFNTTTTSGGVIIGFNDRQTGADQYDRLLYMTDAGAIIFGAGCCGIAATATGPYNDGLSHHVVATLSPVEVNLYVDGVLKNSNNSFPAVGNYGGFWRVGGGFALYYLWTSAPSSSSFAGAIDEVAVYSTVISASRVQSHYLAGKACQTTTSLALNTWNHIAGTFDHSSGVANLYLNGNSQCTQTYSGLSVSGSTSNLIFGSDTSQNNLWSGSLGALKTYSSPLSSAAIQQNYAATAAQFDIQQLGAPSPIMWLRADRIQGLSDGASVSTWPDSSANGNNATQATSANQPVWKKNILNEWHGISA